MDAREDLPKISRNISTAFLDRLDLELESQGVSQDRESFLPHINQFLDTLFAITRPNLRINGRTAEQPYDDDDEEMEPFDEALDRHIWSLSDQRLKWHCRRRTRPTEIEALVQGIYTQHYSQLDPTMEETFVDAVTMSAQLCQSISMQYERANRFTAVLSEVKALKP
ncbi:hypothetical protein BDR03DRAFT_975725 [Suillus americanus]|nr:hypothetical protein BDR03DRAFT_975725 [Suillus americanus]